MMAKHKRGAFEKKAARLRAAAGASAAASSKKPLAHGRSGLQQSRKWGIDSTFADPSLPGTSMQQLALNTRNKASHWDQNSSLRGRPITFVSGGFVEPLTEVDLSGNLIPNKAATNATSSDETNLPKVSDEKSTQIMSPAPILPAKEATKPNPTTQQAIADDSSDSSDEVILFKGRDTRKDFQPNLHIEGVSKPMSATAHKSFVTSSPSHPSLSGHGSLDLLIADSDKGDGSDAAANDYIENMTTEDMADMVRQLAANHRDLGGFDNDIIINIASDDSDDSDESNSSDHGNGDDDGGTISPRVTQDRAGKRDRPNTRQGETHAATDNGSDTDGSDDAWQFATDSDEEHLARLLAKQEELGIVGDELILLDTNSATARHGRLNKRPKRSKGSPPWSHTALAKYDFTKGYRASSGSYPSAEAVADAFEQLEVTGWTGGRGGLELEISDSELENTLKASWQKDRQRKKDRKRAREELRAQGLLGKNANPSDPRIKYPNGMSLDDMKAEFQSFLLGSEHSLILTPMDAHARKIVHEIAHRFNITSKSAGSGDQRRPTLVRTKSTLQFSEELFQSVFAKYRRRFYSRLDNRATGAGTKKITRKGGDPGAASVRNGEVVGGSAPEISLANKGRTMLEKMGWSTGMALGAMDNKGMTQIIEHIVKRSKAGLG